MNTIRITLALVACCIAFDSDASDVTGVVKLKGTPPPERTVDLKADAALAAKHPKGLTTRHYVVGPEGGLQHVLVYIRGTFDGLKIDPPREVAVLDHAKGLFQPYVIGIQVGQPLQFKCSDETICSFVTAANSNQNFSITPMQNIVTRKFTKREVPIRFKCDLHPWNSAYVGVFAHPFFGVTDEQGNFIIKGVPAGRYTMEIFHPKSGSSAKEVVIGDKPTTVNFEVIPR